MRKPREVLRGTLDLLVLRVLSLTPLHSWGIGQRLEELSGDALRIGQGSLHPALQRLEQDGYVTGDWRRTEYNRAARYYRLSASGRRALEEETTEWRDYVAAVERVLSATRPIEAHGEHTSCLDRAAARHSGLSSTPT
jgi:PadR family transcriptional regulator